VKGVEAEIASLPEVRVFRRTQVFGTYDSGTYGAVERVVDHLPVPPAHQPRQRLWRIVARRCVNAMGAIERPARVRGQRPPGRDDGIRRAHLRQPLRGGAGRKVAVFTTTDDGWQTAADLGAAGISVEAVIDPRPDVGAQLLLKAARAGARPLLGATVQDAHGGQALRSIEVRRGSDLTRIEADALAISGGWNPQVALTTHTGAKPRWCEKRATFVPDRLPDGMRVAGAANGDFSLGACLRGGMEAGTHAAGDLGFQAAAVTPPSASDEATDVNALWHVTESRQKAFVDLQNDVTAKDVEIAHQEGFRSVEHLKRYTTLGMATDQGKTSNVNGHAMMAALTGRGMAATSTTMSRPPHLPVAIGTFAGPHRGKHFKATRLTAGHDWALANGATMIEAGQWLRPQWFTKPGEADWLESVTREVKAVRSAVGICDVSTLGKIDIKGPDAGAFLDRVYINTFSTLPVGKVRYGVMLREDGFVMDDGTSARFAPEHFVMSTTTANAAKIMQHLEFCQQVLWPELDVAMVSVTEQWSQYAFAGPRSRELLQKLFGASADLSNKAFPYLACAEFPLGAVTARLFRISFSGELAYEIAVPARYGESLVRALTEAGRDLDATPYGTEALSVLRIEKGHVAGNELNGQTTARDLGLGRMMSTKKDYVGRVLAGRPALIAPDRPSLVGFKPVDASQRLRAGAHFLRVGAAATAENDEGYMTSVAYSPHVGSWIGLGLLVRGPERIGERVRAYDPVRNGDIEVEVVSPAFIDPEGARLHA
jgi:sarcosine oxidase subunit alpha